MKFGQYNDPTTVGDVTGRSRRYKSVDTQTLHDAGGTDPTHCSKWLQTPLFMSFFSNDEQFDPI